MFTLEKSFCIYSWQLVQFCCPTDVVGDVEYACILNVLPMKAEAGSFFMFC